MDLNLLFLAFRPHHHYHRYQIVPPVRPTHLQDVGICCGFLSVLRQKDYCGVEGAEKHSLRHLRGQKERC